MADPIILNVTSDAKVITGLGQIVGTIAFMNGPSIVWAGNIDAIPQQIDPYSVISINKADYQKLFVGT